MHSAKVPLLGYHVGRYGCLALALVVAHALGLLQWATWEALLAESRLRPGWRPRPAPDPLNYSQWLPAPELEHEGCCKHMDPLLCCTAPYNGTAPRALRFGGEPALDPARLAAVLHGKHVLLLGDSVMRQTMSALLCALDSVQTPLLAGRPKASKGGVQYDFQATYGDGTVLSRVSMTRFQPGLLHAALARADTAVVNIGAWYNRPQRRGYERDVWALAGALTFFHRRPGRLALLLDTVPQHFPTERGSGTFSDRQEGVRCVPVDPATYAALGADWHSQAMRQAAAQRGLPFVEVADLFLPRWDAHLERRPKTPTSGSGALDCTHYCHRDSLWHPLLARLTAALTPLDPPGHAVRNQRHSGPA
eukprot:EG_transcript_16813